MKPPPNACLRKTEWDFSTVPKDEIAACLVWELSRESASVREVSLEWKEFFKRATSWHQNHPEPHDQDAKQQMAEFYEEQKILWKKTCDISPKFPVPPRQSPWETMVAQAFGMGELIDASWQDLTTESRAELVGRLKRNPPVFTGDSALALGKVYAKCRNLPVIELPDGYGRIQDASTIDEHGREIVVVVVDWTTYDDSEIQECLQKWIKGRRPAGIYPLVRAGKGRRESKPGSMSRLLNSLGSLRVYAWATLAAIRDCDKDAWQFLKSNVQGSSDSDLIRRNLRTKRLAIEKAFKGIFPNDKNPPLCIQRLNSRRGD